jgi:hypothetical protein
MGFLRTAAVIVTCVAGLGAGLAAQSAASSRTSAIFDAESVWKDFERLASPDLEGRKTGSAGNQAARRLIIERFAEGGLAELSPRFQMPFRFKRQDAEHEGVNVVGLCRGTKAAGGPTIVVSAHYDHVGVRNGETYVGADDNASGTTALMAIAGVCKKAPWQHDVVFAAFDAEEQGLQGARAFVAAPPIPKERIALNINMDMVSRSATREIYIAGTGYHPALRQALGEVVKRSDVTVRFGHDGSDGKKGRDDWTMQSDHGAFHAAGIPFLYFGVEDHPDYHKPTDTIEKVNAVFFLQVVATVLDAVNTLDRSLPSLAK